ncbi:protein kinase [Amycolatopsis sp. SB7-3]|uniref:protein kinase domain-containing protein n=1 Tax=Amycolatopsis sp. SB7-3 TaxID=3373438 RepID=UPI003743D5AF
MERALGSRYRLGDLLGRGAMGQVFAGTDQGGHEFAFKILRSDLTGDPDVVARFLQERSILVGLRHPNLVPVHDLVVEGETVAIVMESVHGGDLRTWLNATGTLLPSEVARTGAGIASALAEVHHAGVVHRDVKPENVLMDDSGSERIPRLTDFGISRLANSSDVGRSSLLAGTPQYVAPELAEGEEATAAADLYSLGIVLYELCCGVTPFAGRSMLQVVRQHAEYEPGRPDGIPDQLWDMISWLLAKGPRARPQSAKQVATMLEAMIPNLTGLPVALPLSTPPAAVSIAHTQETVGAIPQTPRVPAGPPGVLTGPADGVPVPKRRRSKKIALALLVFALVGGGVVVWNSARQTPEATSTGRPAEPGSSRAAPPVKEAETTSSAPTMTTAPDLVGKAVSEAQDSLPSSVQVEIIDSIEQTGKPGTVIGQEPKPGDQLNGKIKLTVAREAVQVYLDELEPVRGEWSSQSAAGRVGGKVLTHTVHDELGCSNAAQAVEYNLAKGFRRLLATAGIDDDSRDTELKVQLEIFADGRKLTSSVLEYGKSIEVNVDLSGVLRLRVQWQPLGSNSDCFGGTVDVGEARLLGLPGEVPSSSSVPTS